MSFTARDFSRKQVYEIAKAYSSGTYSHHDFTKEYGCSQNTFYSVINRAIIEGIVSDEIMEVIELVAVANSTFRMQDETSDQQLVANVAHRGKHANMCRRVKRHYYICSKKETCSLITQYISSPEPKAKFCKQFYITQKLFDRTLKHAIIYSWIPLNTVEQLRQKSYLFNDHEKVDQLFDSCIALRKQNKK